MDPPASRKLLVVEDAFVARGPGVLLMPRFTADALAETSEPMTMKLVRPDGSTAEVKATVDVAHMRGNLAPWAMLRLHGVTVEDVPPGTEVWTTA